MRIGLDIGGTKIDAVVLDAQGAIAHRVRRPTGFGVDAVLEGAASAVRDVLAMSRFDDVDAGATSIGIGIPGVVDHVSGRVRHAVNLGVTDLDLAALMTARLGVAVAVENDVKVAALGAAHLLQLRGSMALLNVGTGLAAGIVSDGTLWRGATGGAGEIGHIPVDPHGAPCSCGQIGCLETIASGSGVARMWPTDADMPALDLFDRADAGEAAAVAVRDRLAFGVATAARMLLLAVDVDLVTIGGGLSGLGARLLDPVRELLRAADRRSPFLASLRLADRVRLLPPGLGAAAVGAALLGARADPER